jgi:hypothetical protein
MKKSYEAPALREHGAVESITAGNVDPKTDLDAFFPVGTLKSDLRFS